MVSVFLFESTALRVKTDTHVSPPGYGQTETILLCGNFLGQEVPPGSMGRPTPGVPLDIVNEDGQVAAAEEEGDIAVATTLASGQEALFICDGYLSRDGGTSLKLRAEKGADNRQWYLTGDRGYRDEDGYIWFVGRSDDVITSSGYRIGQCSHYSIAPVSVQLTSRLLHRPFRSRIRPQATPSCPRIRRYRCSR